MNTHSRTLVGSLIHNERKDDVDDFCYLHCWHNVESMERFTSWKWIHVRNERTIIITTVVVYFCHAYDVLLLVSCFGQDVNISRGRRSLQYKELPGTRSTTNHGVFRPHLLSEIYHMLLVQESLIVCQTVNDKQSCLLICFILYSPCIVAHATDSLANIW